MNLNLTTITKIKVTKFYSRLLLISLVVTLLVISINYRISYLKKQRMEFLNDFEDDDDNIIMYYEYMGEKVAEGFKKFEDAQLLKGIVRKINREQLVHYRDEYVELLPILSVVVIQVHHDVDIEFFNALLYALKFSVKVTNCMLIFSHDYYDDEVNTLIKKMGFARYTQIYYPYSTQLFPELFPGPDFKLCTNDFRCERSALRYEPYVQKKHFWWWQMNHVFDKLNATKFYEHAIIFLEADQFVLKDFIYIVKIIEKTMTVQCPQCEIISLGAHDPKEAQYQDTKTNVTASPWTVDIAGVGIAFNRTVWKSIKNHSDLFCNFDDYRWDASLRHLSLKRDKGPFIFISIDAPRVIKYRRCDGFVECSPERMVEDMATFAATVNDNLVPSLDTLNINKAIIPRKVKLDEIGGWDDDRDKGLCMYLVKS